MYFEFHLFIAFFETSEQLVEFAEERWEPEPDENSSEQEHAAWSDRNPAWALEDELGYYMDSDFVEYHHGKAKLNYVLQEVESEQEREYIRSAVLESHNSFIIVGIDSIYGDKRAETKGPKIREPESTDKLFYVGKFNHTST
jgi:hypothetical protein